VDEYQDFLRATVAFAGNDHRLGAQEAPPAILSIFLGDELTAVVEAIINGTPHKDTGKRMLRVGVDVLPTIRQDNTDRNRTSPMAFTGNKFEFRMLGSSQSISGPNIALNTVMAQELEEFADALEKSGNFTDDLQSLLRKTFADHRRIIFNGNGYDEAWVAEAEKRGLCNLRSTADALPAYTAKKNVELFTHHGIYTKGEIQARYEIHIENYTAVVRIEATTMADMLRRQVLPAVSRYAADLCRRAESLGAMGVASRYETSTAAATAKLTDQLLDACDKLERDLTKVPADPEKAMAYSRRTLVADMEKARTAADALERVTARDYWPVPAYSDLLFSV
jgi:glutamine synthetase